MIIQGLPLFWSPALAVLLLLLSFYLLLLHCSLLLFVPPTAIWLVLLIKFCSNNMWFLLSQLEPDCQIPQTTWVLKSLSFQNHQPIWADYSSPPLLFPNSPSLKKNVSTFSHPSSLLPYLHPYSLIFSSVPKPLQGQEGTKYSPNFPRTSTYQYPFFYICSLNSQPSAFPALSLCMWWKDLPPPESNPDLLQNFWLLHLLLCSFTPLSLS